MGDCLDRLLRGPTLPTISLSREHTLDKSESDVDCVPAVNRRAASFVAELGAS